MESPRLLLPSGGETLWEEIVSALLYSRSARSDFRISLEPEHRRVIAWHCRSDRRVVRLRSFAPSGSVKTSTAICDLWYCRSSCLVSLEGYSRPANSSRSSRGEHDDDFVARHGTELNGYKRCSSRRRQRAISETVECAQGWRYFVLPLAVVFLFCTYVSVFDRLPFRR